MIFAACRALLSNVAMLIMPCLCHALSSTMAPHRDPQMSQASHAITLSDIPPMLLRVRAGQQLEGQG